MTYEKLEGLTAGRSLPLVGYNEDDEAVIIEAGSSEGERFFRVATAQDNGWSRLNVYWEDGTVEELYKK